MKRRPDHRDPAAMLIAILAMVLVLLVPVHAASPGHIHSPTAVAQSHASGGSHISSHGTQHQSSHDHVQETLDAFVQRSELGSASKRNWFTASATRPAFGLNWNLEQPPKA